MSGKQGARFSRKRKVAIADQDESSEQILNASVAQNEDEQNEFDEGLSLLLGFATSSSSSSSSSVTSSSVQINNADKREEMTFENVDLQGFLDRAEVQMGKTQDNYDSYLGPYFSFIQKSKETAMAEDFNDEMIAAYLFTLGVRKDHKPHFKKHTMSAIHSHLIS